MFYNYNEHCDMPTTERIPVSLMTPFLSKWHILFTDNFYTSPSLATFSENGTHLCGTVQTNQWYYSKEISNENLEKGTAAFYNADHSECIIAYKYCSIKDKASTAPKVVYMLSTCHNPAMVQTGKSNHEDNLVIKPTMVSSCITYMDGVDRIDQQLNNIQSLRKSYKWYRKLALQLVMQVMLNTHRIYQIDMITWCTFSFCMTQVRVPTRSVVFAHLGESKLQKANQWKQFIFATIVLVNLDFTQINALRHIIQC